MRVPVICLAVLAAVVLVLPETTGAPTRPEAESYKKKEESSKRVAREGEEQEKYIESRSNINGLASGSKGYTQDKRNSELEEEQSSSTEELKTATGLKKTKKTKKQKKVVASSEHKTVLVYYMVSYRTLPKQKKGECRVDYYKRIFPIEDNLKQFYHKIFKNYENEESKVYIERVEFILNNVYPEYDPRLDVKWLEEFDHYYTLKYSRKIDEHDDSFYPRILAKESGESNEHYKKRMECLVAALDEEDFSHITFDDSELGYKIGVKTTKPNKTSAGSDDEADYSSQVSTSSQKTKAEEESVDESETSFQKAGSSGASASKKEVKKKRTTVEKEVQSKSSTFRMAYNKLPVRSEGQTLEEYYKNYFGQYVSSELTSEAKDELYLRLLIQYRGETAEEYVKRIDYLFDNCYSEFDIRRDATFANLLTHYYRTKYALASSETLEQWCSRVLKKQEGETFEEYKQRVSCLKTALTEVDWASITIDENSSDGYTVVSRGSSSSARSVTKSLTEDEIKKTYFKSDNEDVATYVTRIAKEISSIKSTKDYIDILTVIHKQYPELPLWYSDEYIDVIKNYYVTLYDKKSFETEEDYFKRLVTKESFETDEYYVKRIEILQKLYPTLTLWSNEDYYEKYFKTYYLNVYKKWSEEDEVTYFKRIISKSDDESDFAFITRLNLIKKTYPTLTLWYDSQYFDLVKKYYLSYYEQKTTETLDNYYKRALVKECYETDEEYVKRLQVLQKIFPTLSVWSSDEYYVTYLKAFYEYLYKKSSCEDLDTYYSRIVAQFVDEDDVTYVNRLSLIKRTYPQLDLWYDTKYINLVKKFYTIHYSKKTTETEEEFVQRFVAKESCETDEEYIKKIQILQKIYPSLSLWSDERYYTKYIKECYQILYKQLETEDKEAYFYRIVSRFDDESDFSYVSRLALIQRTYRCLPLWYSEKYYSLVKQFYILKYAQLSGETNDVYISRLVAKEKGDSTDSIYGKRIHLIHLATISSSVWYDEKYYESYTKNYYQSYYKKGDNENCAEWLNRVITVLPGECETDAIKRITLIKKCTDCNCWTLEILSKIECNFSESYITLIKETFFVTSSSYSSSSSSSKNTSSSEEDEEEFTVVSRG